MHPEPTLSVEVWSDVACPWCYVGKRRLEQALTGFAHADRVEVVYRSFELDPSTPVEPDEPLADVLARKYGGGAPGARAMIDRMTAVAAEEGLDFQLDRIRPTATRDAHRLLHLALAEGGRAAQARLKEALLAAYFTDAATVADPVVLREVAARAGLDARLNTGRVEEVLAGTEYDDAVRADLEQARAYGITAVPFVVVDRRYGVAGAQPAEVFGDVLERAWAEAHPGLALVGGAVTGTGPGVTSDADACGPDGCAV